MQNKTQMKLTGSAKPILSLTEALAQSEQVNQLVKESAHRFPAERDGNLRPGGMRAAMPTGTDHAYTKADRT